MSASDFSTDEQAKTLILHVKGHTSSLIHSARSAVFAATHFWAMTPGNSRVSSHAIFIGTPDLGQRDQLDLKRQHEQSSKREK
jgi:hypothetical protein